MIKALKAIWTWLCGAEKEIEDELSKWENQINRLESIALAKAKKAENLAADIAKATADKAAAEEAWAKGTRFALNLRKLMDSAL